MSCPYLKEVVMLFCDAYPVKKMLPLDRIASAHPCLGQDFENCPLFRELISRVGSPQDHQGHQAAGDQSTPRKGEPCSSRTS